MQSCKEYHRLEEAAAGFFFTSALAVSTADPGFVVLGGFSRLLSTVSKVMVALASFLVEFLEGALLGVLLDPGLDTEPKGVGVLDASDPRALGALVGSC